jgi:hypothetical protein
LTGRPLTLEESRQVEDAGKAEVYKALDALGLARNGRLITVRVITLGPTRSVADEADEIRKAANFLRVEVMALADMVEREGPAAPDGRTISHYPGDPGGRAG